MDQCKSSGLISVYILRNFAFMLNVAFQTSEKMLLVFCFFFLMLKSQIVGLTAYLLEGSTV